MALIPTYIPSPNWDIQADGDVVVLGRLIKDPRQPESKLRAYPITPSKIYEGQKIDWQTTLEEIHSAKVGLWAKCMQYIEGGISFSVLKSKLENHRFEVLETTYFLPEEEYFDQLLIDPDVQAYFEATGRWKPIYLITGLKIARGARAYTSKALETSIQTDLKADGIGAGLPINVGPEIGNDMTKIRGVSFSGSTDYIFAYRLTRIKPKRWGDEFRKENFVGGAVFGSGEEKDFAEIKARDAYDFEEVGIDDDEVSDVFLDCTKTVDTE